MNLTLGSLNFQEAGSWPSGKKMAVYLAICAFIVIVGGAWLYFISDKFEELDQGEREEVRLKGDYTERKVKTINHDLYREQLEQVQREFGALLKNLPEKSEIHALLVDVNQAGIARGLQFDLFKPSKEKKAEFYEEIPINIKLTGDYHGMGGFVSDVAALPRVVTVGDIAIAHNKEGVLTMEAVAKTFRYLDEKELAEQAAQQQGAQQQGARK